MADRKSSESNRISRKRLVVTQSEPVSPVFPHPVQPLQGQNTAAAQKRAVYSTKYFGWEGSEES